MHTLVCGNYTGTPTKHPSTPTPRSIARVLLPELTRGTPTGKLTTKQITFAPSKGFVLALPRGIICALSPSVRSADPYSAQPAATDTSGRQTDAHSTHTNGVCAAATCERNRVCVTAGVAWLNLRWEPDKGHLPNRTNTLHTDTRTKTLRRDMMRQQ